MFKNYFKTAIRSLTKNKAFSFINITGLAIGLGAFLLIFQFISFEESFDEFHENSERIYRVQFERIYTDRHDRTAGLTAGTGPAMHEEFPEVESFTKIHSAGYMSNSLTIGDSHFIEKNLFYADNSFFKMFSFGLIEGNPEHALEEVNSIVISETVALNYFGKTDVLNEFIKLENGWGEQLCKVTGVFKNLPSNTHFDFNVLVSFETLSQMSNGQAKSSFGWSAFPTYLLLSPEADYRALEAKFPEFAERKYSRLIERGVKPELYLQPLEDIYLHSNLRFEVGPLGNNKVVKILTGISLFIIVLAYFNYINLSTSKSLERAKEIGVRKVTGANKSNLIIQFLIESFVLNLISIVLGFTLMQISLPFFESALGKSFGSVSVLNQQFLGLVFLLLTAGTLLSGFYPAWVMSRMKAIKVLKGVKTKSGSDALVRKGLVVLQFTILSFLLIGSLAVRSQIDFMLTSDRGFDSEQIIVVNGPASSDNSAALIQTFGAELMSRADVLQVSNSTMIPGNEITWVNNSVRMSTATDEDVSSMPFLGIDDTFINTLSLNLISGRNFNREIKSDTASVMLSREAARTLGFTNPDDAVGLKVIDSNREFLIVGVVEDFLQKSFKTGFDPIIYRYVPQANNFYIIKALGDNYTDLLTAVEDTYKSIYPANPFNYFFLDEFFERQFEEDRTFGTVFNFFTILGIWISCLGLFGLVSYAVTQRRKEIGIRKVLGAKLSAIVSLISLRFIYMVGLSIFIAIPLAFYAINLWLANYTFATDLKAYVFIVPVIAVLVLTLLTTVSLSMRTASKNPVDSLRYE
jgi:putative ABC transport system permease protein